MDRVVERVKFLGTAIVVVFTICAFISTLLTLSPRVTSLEGRMVGCETKISAIEVKLDELIYQGHETGKDVKNIYQLIVKQHK